MQHYPVGTLVRYTDKKVEHIPFIEKCAGSIVRIDRTPHSRQCYYSCTDTSNGFNFPAAHEELDPVSDEEAALYLLGN